MQHLSLLKRLTSLLAMFALGWICKGIHIDIRELTCSDYSTKHAVWVGYSSTKNEQVRCFWVESVYPWRVRQGVAE